jgi:hypothetical protein
LVSRQALTIVLALSIAVTGTSLARSGVDAGGRDFDVTEFAIPVVIPLARADAVLLPGTPEVELSTRELLAASVVAAFQGYPK